VREKRGLDWIGLRFNPYAVVLSWLLAVICWLLSVGCCCCFDDTSDRITMRMSEDEDQDEDEDEVSEGMWAIHSISTREFKGRPTTANVDLAGKFFGKYFAYTAFTAAN